MQRSALWFVGLVYCSIGTMHAQAAGDDVSSSALSAVTAYFEGKQCLVEDAFSSRTSASCSGSFEKLFCQPVPKFRDAASGWFVGFTAAVAGRSTCNHFAIIDDAGRELFTIPQISTVDESRRLAARESSPTLGFCEVESDLQIADYSNAVFVPVSDAESLVGLVGGDPKSWDEVYLYGLEPQPGVLMYDLGEAGGSRSWEAMYYFTDINADGRREVLINRRVRTRAADGGTTFVNQKLIYELEPGTLRPIEATGNYQSQLVDLFHRAKTDDGVLSIGQYCLRNQLNDRALGEAIFPFEEHERGVVYTDVHEPDLGPVAELLPYVFAPDASGGRSAPWRTAAREALPSSAAPATRRAKP